MKKKSIGINLILNVIKSILSVLFPFITLPYISKTLTQDSIGEYTFSVSVINYFLLISALGIKTFAIREASKYRDDKEKFNRFASNMFSLNMFFTVIAYILLALSLLIFKSFKEYRTAVIIASVSIIFSTIGIEWIFNIFEDFAYITYRSIFVQVVSLIMMFTLVRDASDAYLYMAISVIANGGANIFNWFYAKKYCDIKIRFSKEIFADIVPVFTIFSVTLATVIYVNSDLTMLGLMAGKKEVGVYSVASKMYNTVKAVLNGIIPVFFARLAAEYTRNTEEYKKTFSRAVDILACITIPMMVGSFLYGKEIILMLSTEEYLGARNGMVLLFISMFFASMGNLYSQGALLLAGKEKTMLYATSAGAVINIVINFLLIPVLGNLGAAIGTLVTEMLVCTLLFVAAGGAKNTAFSFVNILKCLISTVTFIPLCLLYRNFDFDSKYAYLIFVMLSALVYFILLLLMKYEVAIISKEKVFARIKRMVR